MARLVGSIMVQRPGLPKLTSRLHSAQVLRSGGACSKSSGRFESTWEPEEQGLDEARKLSSCCAQRLLGRKASMSAKRSVTTLFDRNRLTLVALWRYGIACGRSHNAIAAQPHRGSYAAAAWFVVKGSAQMLKGRGDRFRQCIINAGIEAGTRKPLASGR